MCQLFETISVKRGIAQNIEYHQLRFERSYRELWGEDTSFSLANFIRHSDRSTHYRAKFIYDKYSFKVKYYPYLARDIRSLKVVDGNCTDYHLKYLERSDLDLLFAQREQCDDVIIIKDGLVTDTSIANLYFFDGGSWITPRFPLLRGTSRARLIVENGIKECDILASSIGCFERVAISNAMIGFKEIDAFIKF